MNANIGKIGAEVKLDVTCVTEVKNNTRVLFL